MGTNVCSRATQAHGAFWPAGPAILHTGGSHLAPVFSTRAAATWTPSSCSRIGAGTHRSRRFLHRSGRLAPLLLLHVPPNLALQLVEAGDGHEGVHGQQVVIHLSGTAVEGEQVGMCVHENSSGEQQLGRAGEWTDCTQSQCQCAAVLQGCTHRHNLRGEARPNEAGGGDGNLRWRRELFFRHGAGMSMSMGWQEHGMA